MSNLSIPKQYAAGRKLLTSHLDAIVDSVEDYLNVTQVGYENIQIDPTLQAITSTSATTILTAGGYGNLTTQTLASTSTITSTATNFCTLTLPSAGKFLVTGIAVVTLSCNVSDISIESAAGGTIDCDLVYGASNTVIQSCGIEDYIRYDQVESSSGTLLTSNVLTYSGVIEVSAATTVSFRASSSIYTGASGTFSTTILTPSEIQAFRLRDS